MTTVFDSTRQAHPTPTGARSDRQRPKPVTVNGVVISRSDIARETQHHPAAKAADAWIAATRALVVRELLLQEARRLAIAPEPARDDGGRTETTDDALVRQLIEREVLTPEPDDASCQRIYEQRRNAFRSSDLYAVRHILLPARRDDHPAHAETRCQAEAMIAAVAADPRCFTEFATTWSACPSKMQGGSLGQISRGQTVPEFEAALATAPVGRVSEGPVETRYGFHVIFVDNKIEGEVLPFHVVKEGIARWLAERSQQTAIRQYISLLAGRATITGIELQASTTSLVQ